jgi:DNA-binding response OmpR family regulator
MSPRILFIEDEVAFAVGVRDRLKAEGYTVELVQDGEAGFGRAKDGSFDLILLDVMLPGKRGFDICRDLRQAAVNTPILMLTARGEVTDKVVGLKLGADDYVVKNCDALELLARIEALLRRNQSRVVRTAERFEFGEIRVDLKNNEVTRGGNPVALSRAEFRLLKYLLEHRGSVVTREELLEKVWGMAGGALSRTVDVHMASLRRKLEPDPRYPVLIVTVKGFGYKLAV